MTKPIKWTMQQSVKIVFNAKGKSLSRYNIMKNRIDISSLDGQMKKGHIIIYTNSSLHLLSIISMVKYASKIIHLKVLFWTWSTDGFQCKIYLIILWINFNLTPEEGNSFLEKINNLALGKDLGNWEVLIVGPRGQN